MECITCCFRSCLVRCGDEPPVSDDVHVRRAFRRWGARTHRYDDDLHRLGTELARLVCNVSHLANGVRTMMSSCDAHLCILCMDQPRGAVLRPCRHMITCRACAAECTVCPVCRHEVHRVVEVFT